jgi:hypothetical protein
MCKMLLIGVSSYYAWLQRKPGKRQLANANLDIKIKAVFEVHKHRYGWLMNYKCKVKHVAKTVLPDECGSLI